MNVKVHLLPNLITAFGLSCGLFAIFKMNMLETAEVDYHVLAVTAAIVLLAALADFVDGALARMMKVESSFGGIFDSLADAISFGVAPSVIILKTLSGTLSDELSYLLTLAAMVFSVCGVLRLARFNATRVEQPPEALEETVVAKKNFTGLPIPAAAAVAVSTNLLLISPDFQRWFAVSDSGRMWILFSMMLVLGYFMISRWKFPSLKSLHIRVASFRLVFLTALSAIFLFYGVLHHAAIVAAFISWAYVITAWVFSLLRVVSGRRSQILIDYEPEPDELGV